ncbi:MAG: radical SAM protein [Candidatus Omnitrophota bacterium]
MSYFYGPVPSRRLGFSLGVDLFPKKICSFDCVYCQLGRLPATTQERFSCVDMRAFKSELKTIIKKNPKIDYISLSGSGEPTLHRHLDTIIATIKKVTRYRYPVCVITNSSLLYREDVRRELKEADVVVPSLDAASSETFYKINRPYPGITLEQVVDGLFRFRKVFKGSIWLEIMLVAGYNDSLAQARLFSEIVKKLRPEKVQLNLPVRPATSAIKLPSFRRIEAIRKIIGLRTEIVASCHKETQRKLICTPEKAIITFLRRRPATLEDLRNSLGMTKSNVGAILSELLMHKKIKARVYLGKKHFGIYD